MTIAEVLRAGGYQTMASGKWHVTPVTDSKHNWPLQRGFEHYYGIIHGSASYFQPPMLVRDNEKIAADRTDFYLTDGIGENAVAYIQAAASKPDPFFLYVPFTSPHWPLHAFESDIARYKGRYAQGWDALRDERQQRMIRMGIVDKRWGLTPRDRDVPAWKDCAGQGVAGAPHGSLRGADRSHGPERGPHPGRAALLPARKKTP